ncbi:hypothetical protein A3D42_00175 [Candidatus Nomurabacteria bacterium RIFCSPHIGHO2_02_FULL_41_18]|uniref:ATP synthase subunit delta n=1 Tax=Candidatus Nomurabacteria bacterium RIFCSPHIGHO2_02_FULL_41_18 TaxID=1801754 RepID=A0A1F6W6X3_9BACT|nr:MAG: hypothetical protein A2737_03060 [Candidatus Nomurabacteria bacterium RIFCSPHIGHO2_01_FULL_41_71]OGI77687.1 MAG: hypothetical protein A3D42_00175 [Candidatus Nomurabacteria bacterium RIFCSPHIGHO2_02_FULL_41_18]OGI89032.1 MAG: hypothetical protein A3B01_00435 [Candidatus Nomurabacteria bacterium RIFCSPLOWO2_01_FULL_41_52b]OGJ00373.1 MAG: hypothetical protein A3I90_00750 [Candidatus Nomurabacteria bacterium RIFCSPLOWO2_02_FULL_41_9]
MAILSDNNIAHAIYLSLKDKSLDEAHQTHKNILAFLARKHLLGRAAAILLHLKKIINLEKGIVSATVSSVHRLHEKEEKELVHFLKKRYSAKEITLTKILDQNLLGGFRVEANDEVIDLTIKNKIMQLQKYLTRSAV